MISNPLNADQLAYLWKHWEDIELAYLQNDRPWMRQFENSEEFNWLFDDMTLSDAVSARNYMIKHVSLGASDS